MHFPLTAIFLGTGLAVAVADRVPRLNIDPTCNAAAASGIAHDQSTRVCKQDELTARDQLDKQWTQFPSADKLRCVQVATMGGQPSYVELLTCLEMAREVRNLHSSDKSAPKGQSR
jgi:hypothetical protein